METVTGEIERLSHVEPKCRRLMSVPGIGPLISTALVAVIGTGELRCEWSFSGGKAEVLGTVTCFRSP